jgi:hypothetical protein
VGQSGPGNRKNQERSRTAAKLQDTEINADLKKPNDFSWVNMASQASDGGSIPFTLSRLTGWRRSRSGCTAIPVVIASWGPAGEADTRWMKPPPARFPGESRDPAIPRLRRRKNGPWLSPRKRSLGSAVANRLVSY